MFAYLRSTDCAIGSLHATNVLVQSKEVSGGVLGAGQGDVG